MGLDFAIRREEIIDGPGWSCGGFNDFRCRLASEIGINLHDMQGFGSRGRGTGSQPWDTIDDPIVPLLDHSDCDGELSAEECREVAPRLRELIGSWPQGDFDRQCAETLADAMDEVARDELVLVFT
jgi:hypothetical protein